MNIPVLIAITLGLGLVTYDKGDNGLILPPKEPRKIVLEKKSEEELMREHYGAYDYTSSDYVPKDYTPIQKIYIESSGLTRQEIISLIEEYKDDSMEIFIGDSISVFNGEERFELYNYDIPTYENTQYITNEKDIHIKENCIEDFNCPFFCHKGSAVASFNKNQERIDYIINNTK